MAKFQVYDEQILYQNLCYLSLSWNWYLQTI